jgi:hypothetical protein
MKTILAITAAIFAATPALAYSYATQRAGELMCKYERLGYSVEEAADRTVREMPSHLRDQVNTDTDSGRSMAHYMMEYCPDVFD